MTTSTMSKRGSGQDNVAPGQEGRTDRGYENLQVKLLHFPDKMEFGKLMTKASVAVKGSIVGDDEIDEVMVDDMLRGGLNQALEWVSVVFEVSGVSRGVTHQLVRTRKASFAQQSMRYADMGSFNARMPLGIAKKTREIPGYWDTDLDQDKYPNLASIFVFEDDMGEDPERIWNTAISVAREAYAWLADHGVDIQDARTVCPIATETYILCEYPLSEFLNTYAYRACSMFYPETVYIFREMGRLLAEACPWLKPHIKIGCEKTSGGIEVDTGIGPYQLPHKCTYQGWERVEGQCDFEWALEDNRVFKSRKVDK